MILIVAYDLHNPGRDYADIKDLLETASGGYQHIQGSVWLLDTLKSPAQWRNWLRERGDSNDEYFVGRLYPSTDWASYNMDSAAAAWLKSPSRRW